MCMNDFELFLFTFEEYKRLIGRSEARVKHKLTDTLTDDEYRDIQFSIIVLRKYTSKKKERVSFENILEQLKQEFPNELFNVKAFEDKWTALEDSEIHTYFGDREPLSLRQVIDLELYGIHLHSDPEKIKILLGTDAKMRHIAVRKYVEDCEELVFDIAQFLHDHGYTCPDVVDPNTAEIMVVNPKEGVEQRVTASPYWVNIFGRDASGEEFFQLLSEENPNAILIIVTASLFTYELEKDDYSIDVLSLFVDPETYKDWGDFSKAHQFIANLKDIGFSSHVRFDETGELAYVAIFEHVENGVLIEGEQLVNNINVITLRRQPDSDTWLVFGIGGKIEKVVNSINLNELAKNTVTGFRKLSQKIIGTLEQRTKDGSNGSH